MGRIIEPELAALAEKWSGIVRRLLEHIGKEMWPPVKEPQGLLERPRIVQRFVLEGPVRCPEGIAWAVSHTRRPSTFGDDGSLSEGEREFWKVILCVNDPHRFLVQGAQSIEDIALDEEALSAALEEATQSGPCIESFYGNRGPLSQR